MRILAALMVLSASSCFEAQGAGQSQAMAEQSAASTAHYPDLTGRVVDQAGLLSPEQVIDLTSKSEALEAQTGRQLVIATVNSLGGEDIASFSSKLGNYWGIGRQGINDGTILVVAPNERQVRIAVGDGLRDALPDEAAARIIREDVLPQFRQGNMAAGIMRGADALIDRLAN